MGKVIHRKLCQRLRFGNADKWYKDKTESVLENEMHTISLDFEIQKDHPIPTRRPDLILINKKKMICHLVDFVVPTDHRMKIKDRKRRDKYLDFVRVIKKLWNMKLKVIVFILGALGTIPKSIDKSLREMEIKERIKAI